jgi:hypothetical protein
MRGDMLSFMKCQKNIGQSDQIALTHTANILLGVDSQQVIKSFTDRSMVNGAASSMRLR